MESGQRNNDACLVKLEPPDELIFTHNGNIESISFLTIENLAPRNVCFKIMSNRPQKFIVSPPEGILSPYEIFKVQIRYKRNENSIVNGNKFLIFFVESNDITNVDWKKSSADHKLGARLEEKTLNNCNGPIARIVPEDSIVFQSRGPEQGYSELMIQNLTDKQLSFQIKTTHPIEFVVSPSKGIIEGLNQVQISLTYKLNCESLTSSRKFLISCCQSDKVSTADWAQGVLIFKLSSNAGQNL